MAHITKRGKAYRVIVQAGGMRRERSVRCSHTDAKRLGRDMERDLAREAKRERVGLPGVVRFSDMLDRYEAEELPTKREATQVSYRNTIAPLRLYFVETLRDPRLGDVLTDHIAGYLNWLRDHGTTGKKLTKPLSERTREKEWALLHRMFAIAVRRGWMEGTNPVDRVEKPKHKGRPPVLLTYDQTEKLLAECEKSKNPTLPLYVLLLAETGLRSKSEAHWIKWDHVALDHPIKDEDGEVVRTEGRIYVESGYRHATKGGKSRYVSMPPRLRAAMRDHFAQYRLLTYEGQRSEWVFHHLSDNRTAKAGERVQSMYRGFKKAAKRAKLPSDLRPHDLRHRWVTLSLADGVPIAHVKEAAGHADYATTDGYANLNADQYLGGFEKRYKQDAETDAGAVNK